jgi:DNA polymerase/3'-5' exonuclease PolX
MNSPKKLADSVVAELAPHCLRIEIAGSIRRKKEIGIKDIEIVAIPKPWETGLFADGIATVVSQWKKIKGDVENDNTCKYTQRLLPSGINLDLFFATEENWGLILAIRTGPSEYSHKVLARGWVNHRYKSIKGMLYHTNNKMFCPVPTEQDLYNKINLPYLEPERRVYYG